MLCNDQESAAPAAQPSFCTYKPRAPRGRCLKYWKRFPQTFSATRKMAPVKFKPHACDHCRNLIIEAHHCAGNNVNHAPPDMGRDKIAFSLTFRDLKLAAAGGCSLCRWILDGEAVSRLDIIDEDIKACGSDVSLVMADYDDHPDRRHASLLHAVRASGTEVDLPRCCCHEPSFPIQHGLHPGYSLHRILWALGSREQAHTLPNLEETPDLCSRR